MTSRGTHSIDNKSPYPELEISAVRWRPEAETEIRDGKLLFTNYDPIVPVPDITHQEEIGMDDALDQASLALKEGDLPVGATIILPDGFMISQRTNDNIANTVRGHAELRLFDFVESKVGADFSKCTLITTVQPCATCATEYAAAHIGKVIYGSPREYVKPLTDKMRKRILNFPEKMGDGNVNTKVIAHYRATGAIALLAAYGKKHSVVPKLDGMPEFVRLASEGKLVGDEYADTVQELYFGTKKPTPNLIV